MKKFLMFAITVLFALLLVACGEESSEPKNDEDKTETEEASGNKKLEKLSIGFVPSRTPWNKPNIRCSGR